MYLPTKLRDKLDLRNHIEIQKSKQRDSCVHYYNFFSTNFETLWFSRFLSRSGLLDKTSFNIAFWSVFGRRDLIDYISRDINIFFSGESIHRPEYTSYADYCLGDDRFQLALGFDYFEDTRYLRFPLWIMYYFRDCFTKDDVIKRCSELNQTTFDEHRQRFACAVSSWDPIGIRGKICDSLEGIGQIDYPGKWRHNDDSLKDEYNDKKTSYLKNYIFNICPENSNAMGYTTEKVWEALASGCIPIYWGSMNMPEPGILNPESIILWTEESSSSVADYVRYLIRNPKELKLLAEQPRLLPTAPEKIWTILESVEQKLTELLLGAK